MVVLRTIGLFSLIYILLSLNSIQNICGQTMNQANSLYTTLLNGYNPEIRPATNLSEPTDLLFHFNLNYINDIDEPAGKLVTTGYLTLQWYDPRMVWDPTSYGGISSIVLPRNSVWRPEFSVINFVQKMDLLGHSKLPILYTYNGSVAWTVGDKIETICDFDVTNYPFDSQTCSIEFVALGLFPSDIKMTVPESVDITFLKQNDEWHYDSSSLEVVELQKFSRVFVTIRMSRLYDFFQLIYFAPVIILSILNAFVFMLPADSGERVGFAITCLLAVAVLLTEVSGQLPSNATPMPKISVFITSMFVGSAALCLLTMLNLRLYVCDQNKSVPNWIQSVYKCFMCNTGKYGSGNVIVTPVDNENEERKLNIPNQDKQNTCDTRDIQWKDVSDLLDKVCFIGAFLFNLTSLLVYIFGVMR